MKLLLSFSGMPLRRIALSAVVAVFYLTTSAATPVDGSAADNPAPMRIAEAPPLKPAVPVGRLIAEALAHNPELAAVRATAEAAERRVAPAGALDDPILEAGIVNVSVPAFNFRQDDMTMKMLGLSQKLPYPGKRALRTAVASADSASVTLAIDERSNRVVRDVRVAYEELRLADTTERLLTRTRATVKNLSSISESRYSIGQAAQSDVLQAQTRLIQLQQDVLKVRQERLVRASQLNRLLGRREASAQVVPTPAVLNPLRADGERLARDAAEQRPQLRALDALVQRGDREVELAEREYYPDFELRLGFGQRDRAFNGMRRDDMVTMTVAVGLPIWRKSRLEPRVAEARALRREASAMVDAGRLDTLADLDQQLAVERQTRDSAELYQRTMLPQVRAIVESALNAYRVGRVDFLTLLDAQMREYDAERGAAEALALHNKAIAEIDLLTGVSPQTIAGAAP